MRRIIFFAAALMLTLSVTAGTELLPEILSGAFPPGKEAD